MDNLSTFSSTDLLKLWKPASNSSGEDNGQVTIIGGSELFHGAPLLALKAASKFVDMVFFATPEKSVGMVAQKMKSSLLSFVWVPWEEASDYVIKSDCCLIGPGMMRFKSEKRAKLHTREGLDEAGSATYEIVRRFLTDFPMKRWVIDAGALQVMEKEWIPRQSILTPNKHEFEMLFGDMALDKASQKYECTIVLKGPVTLVSTCGKTKQVKGGNPGLTKGGTGDVLAGLTTALYAKNDTHLSACAASFIQKKVADRLFKEVGQNYSAEDLANSISNIN